jgi:hypothetical protein
MKYYIGTTSEQKIAYIQTEIKHFIKSRRQFVSVSVNRAIAAYQSGTDINRWGIGLEAGLIKVLGNNLSLVCGIYV